MESARRHGVVVSYDLNYRTSLWKSNGGSKKAQPSTPNWLGWRHCFCNEEDFSVALGFAVAVSMKIFLF